MSRIGPLLLTCISYLEALRTRRSSDLHCRLWCRAVIRSGAGLQAQELQLSLACFRFTPA
jgi:hypothetical protein